MIKTVFIGDSDSLVIKKEILIEVLNYLYITFPKIERVTSYARAKTVYKKTIEELRNIFEAGLTRLHVGLETGDEELLKEIKKGASSSQMIEAGQKAKEAGFEYSIYILMGIGGEERWEQHARNTAIVLNQINPHFIRIRTFIPQPSSPLYELMMRGDFKLAGPDTILKETRLLLSEPRVNSEFLSDHISNLLPINGKLPEDKEKMIRLVDEALEIYKKDVYFKQEIETKRHLTNL